jgi:hypothetical protein
MALRMFEVAEQCLTIHCVDVDEKESAALMPSAMGPHQLRMPK